jgi:hypothetical protein
MGGRCLCSSNRPTVFGLSGWDVEACLAAAGQHIPSHHSRVPLILLLLLIPPATAVSCVFLLVHCTPLTPPSLAYNHQINHTHRSVCLFKSRRSNTLTHHHSPPQNCWSPTALTRATPKKKRSLDLLLCLASHTTIRTPLIKIPPPSASSISRVTASITTTERPHTLLQLRLPARLSFLPAHSAHSRTSRS